MTPNIPQNNGGQVVSHNDSEPQEGINSPQSEGELKGKLVKTEESEAKYVPAETTDNTNRTNKTLDKYDVISLSDVSIEEKTQTDQELTDNKIDAQVKTKTNSQVEQTERQTHTPDTDKPNSIKKEESKPAVTDTNRQERQDPTQANNSIPVNNSPTGTKSKRDVKKTSKSDTITPAAENINVEPETKQEKKPKAIDKIKKAGAGITAGVAGFFTTLAAIPATTIAAPGLAVHFFNGNATDIDAGSYFLSMAIGVVGAPIFGAIYAVKAGRFVTKKTYAALKPD